MENVSKEFSLKNRLVILLNNVEWGKLGEVYRHWLGNGEKMKSESEKEEEDVGCKPFATLISRPNAKSRLKTLEINQFNEAAA